MFTQERLTLLATATSLFAQNDYNLDKTSPGTLGSTLTLAISAAPASALGLVMVSFSGGPTSIAAFDPNDPRRIMDPGTQSARDLD